MGAGMPLTSWNSRNAAPVWWGRSSTCGGRVNMSVQLTTGTVSIAFASIAGPSVYFLSPAVRTDKVASVELNARFWCDTVM